MLKWQCDILCSCLTTCPTGSGCVSWVRCCIGEFIPLPGNEDARTMRVPSQTAPPESVQRELLQATSPFHFLVIHRSFCHSSLSVSFPEPFDLVKWSNEIFVKG